MVKDLNALARLEARKRLKVLSASREEEM